MSSSCKFQLNKPQPIYFSGEIISGTITLTRSDDENVRDVSIIFLGEGKVKWEETSTISNGNSTLSDTTSYKSHEKYINNCTRVHGDGVLPKGIHTYNFSIPLPLQCPTSIEGEYGHIRYELILKINRYYRFDNVYKKPITVIKTVDLNLDPIYKIPVAAETVKTLCCWPCTAGKIIYILTVPFGAFVPGQTLKYILNIHNQSMNNIVGYFIQFIRKKTFTAKSPSKSKRSTKDILVSKNYTENCLRLTNRIIEGGMRIPSTPPSTSRNDIIYVEYKFKAVLKLSGCSSNIELEVPIDMGTIPVRESLPNYQSTTNNSQQQHEQTTTVEGIPEIQGDKGNSPPKCNDIDPPTFEEATKSSAPFVDTDVDPQNRIDNFKPLYPIYKK